MIGSGIHRRVRCNSWEQPWEIKFPQQLAGVFFGQNVALVCYVKLDMAQSILLMLSVQLPASPPSHFSHSMTSLTRSFLRESD
jgi:hypothetical protein